MCEQKENIHLLQFNENILITRESFPSLTELQAILYKEDFNTVLNTVKQRIIQAKRTNMNFARMTLLDFNMIPLQIVNDVKDFLRKDRGYTIVDIEDNANIVTGCKISF
jgi:hypothetical protein